MSPSSKRRLSVVNQDDDGDAEEEQRQGQKQKKQDADSTTKTTTKTTKTTKTTNPSTPRDPISLEPLRRGGVEFSISSSCRLASRVRHGVTTLASALLLWDL